MNAWIIIACDPGCVDSTHNHAITLETTPVIDFTCHFEDGKAVIDRCEGISPEDGLSVFPDWALDAISSTSR